MMDRKERDKQLRKADILRAAENVFASKGYHEATIQDIAKQAQYGTGTVYLYFKDKNALYFSLLEEKIQSLINNAKEKTEQAKDAKKKLEIFIRESLVFFEQNQSFFRIYMLEKNSIQLIVSKKVTESFSVLEHATEYVEKLIKHAQEENVIKKNYSPSELADILASIMGSMILNWTKSDLRKVGSLKDKTGFIFDMFLNGAGK
ncbi:MAG: TetR/AcrR family transcriptional regulator [Candidatus Omnitrophota bacterium]